MKVMFDTNVFCHIREGKIDTKDFPVNWNVFATHIQKDEIQRTSNKKIRKQLLQVFSHFIGTQLPTESQVIGISQIGQAKITGNTIPTESAVWGVSKWGKCKWTPEDSLYRPILNELNKRKKKSNNLQDALIAETATKNDLTLVTNDQDLKEVAEFFGCKVIDLINPPSAV